MLVFGEGEGSVSREMREERRREEGDGAVLVSLLKLLRLYLTRCACVKDRERVSKELKSLVLELSVAGWRVYGFGLYYSIQKMPGSTCCASGNTLLACLT